MNGSFADPRARRALFTTGKGDALLVPIYAGSAGLTVVGGTANPPTPQPGEIVSITADPGDRADARGVFYWTTDGLLDLPHPHQRSVTFPMPSQDVTLTARWLPAQ